MYKLAFVAAAAAMAFVPSLAPTSAQAATKIVVSPVYVPAIYCDYKSEGLEDEGHRHLPDGLGTDRLPRHSLEGQQVSDQLLEHLRRRR